jgi:hypothetical protein
LSLKTYSSNRSQVLIDGESVAKSRPLLGTSVKDVEVKLREHDDQLTGTIHTHLVSILIFSVSDEQFFLTNFVYIL